MISKLMPFGAMAAIIVGVLSVLSVSGAIDNDSSGDSFAREAEDGEGVGADVAGICVEGTVDCDDTVTSDDRDDDLPGGDDLDEAPPADGPISICIEGATDCGDMIDEPIGICAEGEPECDDIVEDPALHDPDEDLAIEAAFAAFAEMGGRDAKVSGIRPVEWGNACLGVEQEGVACAEVITPGFIVFLSGDSDYEFHTDLNGNAVFAGPQ